MAAVKRNWSLSEVYVFCDVLYCSAQLVFGHQKQRTWTIYNSILVQHRVRDSQCQKAITIFRTLETVLSPRATTDGYKSPKDKSAEQRVHHHIKYVLCRRRVPLRGFSGFISISRSRFLEFASCSRFTARSSARLDAHSTLFAPFVPRIFAWP
jgi:hypothetical protein